VRRSVDVHGRFGGVYCLNYQGLISLMMEAVILPQVTGLLYLVIVNQVTRTWLCCHALASNMSSGVLKPVLQRPRCHMSDLYHLLLLLPAVQSFGSRSRVFDNKNNYSVQFCQVSDWATDRWG
jgi:hypothetical protein